MSDHRLRRRAGQVVRALAERDFHGARLDAVVQIGRSAVVVDVADVTGINTGVFDRQLHRPRRLFARFVHAHAMMRVARRAVAPDFGVDLRAARTGGLLALHHEHPRTLGQDEAVAIFGERTRGALRLVIAGVGHDPHHTKSGHHRLGDGRIGAPANHVVDDAQLQVAIRVTHRVRRRSAAGRDQMRETVKVVSHRDFRGDRADRAGGDGVDRCLPLGVVEPELVHPLAELHRPAARPQHDADALPRLEIERLRIEPRVAQRFRRRSDGHGHDARDVADVLRIDPGVRVEVDFAGYATRQTGGVELGDRTDAGTPGCECVEIVFATNAVWAEDADAGDDDSRGHCQR